MDGKFVRVVFWEERNIGIFYMLSINFLYYWILVLIWFECVNYLVFFYLGYEVFNYWKEKYKSVKLGDFAYFRKNVIFKRFVVI